MFADQPYAAATAASRAACASASHCGRTFSGWSGTPPRSAGDGRDGRDGAVVHQVAERLGRKIVAMLKPFCWPGVGPRKPLLTLARTKPTRAGDADGILVTVRRSKTNQDGKTNDVRYMKNGAARAGRVVPFSAQMIGLRFTAAARAAGVERRVTAPLGTGRPGEGTHQPWRVNHRRDARRQLEDLRGWSPTIAPALPPSAAPWRVTC